MEKSNKRKIPRHVDGRIMVGTMFWKSFVFKFLPLAVLLVIFLFLNFTPVTLFFSFIFGGLIFFLFSEINNKETGIDFLKALLKYKKQGTIILERSTKNDGLTFRYIRHKARYEQEKDAD